MNAPKQRTRKVLNDEEYEAQLVLKDRALAGAAEGITISDRSLPDNPLIYANEGFERLTGYSIEEVIGRNCRFLQGPDTDPETVAVIREAIRTDSACTVQILNYRKDGRPFWNRLSITPVRDSSGRVTNHIGIQSDITAQKNAEDALREAKRKLQDANERMRRDLEAAARVQRAMLPDRAPAVDGVSFAWSFLPSAELAGDIFNVFLLQPGLLAMYILDVSGHGVASALLSVAVSRMLSPLPGRSLLFEDPGGERVAEPASVVSRLNEYFPFDPRTSQYFTLIYGLLDIASGRFRYVAAGHHPPVVVPREGAPRGLEPGGPPVGILPDMAYEEQCISLLPGDRAVLFTDGVIETENAREEEFGGERLTRSLQESKNISITESVESVIAEVTEWCGGKPQQDDITVLAFEMEAAGRPG